MSRATLIACVGATTTLASCSSYGGPPVCQNTITISAPCGFLNVSTTCAGATASCTNVGGIPVSCGISPIKANCTISVVVGDLSKHSVAVTVGPSMSRCVGNNNMVVSPAFQDFSSPTCQSMFLPEAGMDDGATDDAQMGDGAADALEGGDG